MLGDLVKNKSKHAYSRKFLPQEMYHTSKYMGFLLTFSCFFSESFARQLVNLLKCDVYRK